MRKEGTLHFCNIMAAEIQRGTDNFRVSLSPTNKQVKEIEQWLRSEKEKTGGGFYCNWNIIKSSFDNNELVTISLNNRTIGFATWRRTTGKTARIEIAKVKHTHREKGIGKKLTGFVLDFLKDSGVCVVDLQCSPSDSEPFWKRLGFVEFPDPPENYNLNSDDNKELYLILTEHLQTSLTQLADETIELWNYQRYKKDDNTPPTYIWNVKLIERTRRLLRPIIHPAHYDWRLRWRIDGKIIYDGKVKRFKPGIDFRKYIIIDELAL